jgi:hypothetical protein
VREDVLKTKIVLTLALTCFLSPGERTNARPSFGSRGAAGCEDVPEQILILNHRGKNLTTKDTKDTKKKFGRLGLEFTL